MGDEGRYRLGRAVVPELYTIMIEPDMKKFVFKGYESISADVSKPSSSIIMNAAELAVEGAEVVSKGSVIKAKPVIDQKLQRLTLSLNKKVSGKVEIHIRFTGKHNDKMYGFYRSEYDSDGKKQIMLSTQFEAANARNAFPCFDEPELKAQFEISLAIRDGYECISNMPAKRISTKNGKRTFEFERSPRMSTYLVYMGVGKYSRLEGRCGGIKVRALATPGKKEYLKIPLEYAVRFIKYYEDYFGVKYPLKKMDILAIPDFAAGAMENWGAVTFREVAMLATKKSSVAEVQRIAEVVAHELAHQWFGDLVTMEWWNDIWLNESFATFMSYKAMNAVFPEWRADLQYIEETIDVGLTADGISSTHPIEVTVNSPADMDSAFDEISYEKGGSVLSMIEDYCGEETFRKGLHNYIKKHSFSNAVRDDLWTAIDDAAEKDGKKLQVKKVANEWITRKGYPYINVKGSESFELHQERFAIDNDNYNEKPWPIPVTYSSENDKEKRVLMDKKDITISGCGSWIKLNYGQKGFYRAFYEKSDRSRIAAMINEGRIEWLDGWGVAGDLFVLARSARIKAEEYVDFAEMFSKRCEYPMVARVVGQMHWVRDMLPSGNSLVPRINELLDTYAEYHLRKLGWSYKNGESTIDTDLRSMAIVASAVAGNSSTIRKAEEFFAEIKKGKEFNSNIRRPIMRVAAENGDAVRYNWFKEKYMKETDPYRKREYLGCLGLFQDKKLVDSSLAFSLSKYVRLQDSLTLPAVIAGNAGRQKRIWKAGTAERWLAGKDVIWHWTRDNWKTLMKRNAIGTHALGRYIENLSVISDSVKKKEIESFFEKKGNVRDDIKPVLAEALGRISTNIKFREFNSE